MYIYIYLYLYIFIYLASSLRMGVVQKEAAPESRGMQESGSKKGHFMQKGSQKGGEELGFTGNQGVHEATAYLEQR